jgi:hypothetical protein
MRARNIKPGYFTNEDLAECTVTARLCFAGLWMLADREGRLEDRAKRIKAELFAFDSIEVEPLLVELVSHGFVTRYEVDGQHLIQVLGFKRHQNPHVKERPSELPAMPSTGLGRHGMGAKPGALDPRSALSSVESPADSLIPDSLIPDSLIPDSLIPGAAAPVPELALARAEASPHHSQLDGMEDVEPHVSGKTKAGVNVGSCPHNEILALWTEVLPTLPQHLPAMWRGTRSDHLRARWKETAVTELWVDKAAGLTYFRRLFAFIGQSDFLMGRAKVVGDRRPFMAELEWVIRPSNWAKVVEGKYHEDAP